MPRREYLTVRLMTISRIPVVVHAFDSHAYLVRIQTVLPRLLLLCRTLCALLSLTHGALCRTSARRCGWSPNMLRRGAHAKQARSQPHFDCDCSDVDGCC